MDKNLALEFVRITEKAAISCSHYLGKGDKIKADNAAVNAMREKFNQIDFKGVVVIGEGEKDEAPMLFNGEKLGNGTGPEMDIAVDPLECTSNLANGKPNAITVLAAGPKGSLLKAPGSYMNQLAVGPKAKGVINIRDSITKNLKKISKAIDKELDELTICVLDRKRHENLIKEIRKLGCRIRLIEHGTISAGISVAIEGSGIDVMVGIGGAPEAIITAVGLKCLGGDMQAMLAPHNEIFKKQMIERGMNEEKVYLINDLAKGTNLVFSATGVSDGHFLKGVIFKSHEIITHSLVMRSKSKTVRYLKTIHNE